ncbi:helix-turn-helix domain-containing protein, partial [Haloactinomyces albus]
MRGMTSSLTIGERIAWYRRRRGMPQEVLAGRIGRTVDWLSKVENNRIDLDRLSVIRTLAEALDVTIGDLIGEPTLLEWNKESGTKTVPALRAALMDYRQLTPLLGGAENDSEPPELETLRQGVGDVFAAYQESRYGFVTGRTPLLLSDAALAAQAHGSEGRELLALSYQAATSVLTKLGEVDLAWIAAERGLNAAQQVGNPLILGSLFRSVTHALLSTGRFPEAVQLTRTAADVLQPSVGEAGSAMLSVYGSLFLAGSMAAARCDDRSSTSAFLSEAQESADRLGGDGNYLWTAFGPSNVSIHRVATAMELGDVQVAVDVGPTVDTSALPLERQVRHALETARAFSAWNRTDEALSIVLDAEQRA